METVRDFIFGGSKMTANGDCSHEIKRCLLLGLLCTERPLRGGLCDGLRQTAPFFGAPARGAQSTMDAEGCAQRGH